MLLLGMVVACAAAVCAQTAAKKAGESWRFAVSGDSRNCGDIVMPAIAAGVERDGAQLYWHLGDYRALSGVDEDYLRLHPGTTLADYRAKAWPDFIQHQLKPFGDLPVFLSIGNHELVAPMNRNAYLAQFSDWLDQPAVRKQRLADNANDREVRTYYHWIYRGVDFIALDNASADELDANQMTWLQNLLQRDSKDASVRALVLGMHAAFPESMAAGHSMNDAGQQQASGRQAYAALLAFRNSTRKHVYILASHSHFVMNNIYDNACRPKQDVLPGWIIGTAGAIRYRLPVQHAAADVAMTDVYGYLLGTVAADGTIQFAFKPVQESEVPAATVKEFTADEVHWCFAKNSSTSVIGGPTCPAGKP